MEAEREAFLLQVLRDHAPEWSGPHAALDLGVDSAARYTWEVHVRPHDGTLEEWNWMEDYLHRNPEILQNPPVTDAELRRRQEAAQARARDLSSEAYDKYTAGQYPEALALIDAAEKLAPSSSWNAIRAKIRDKSQPG